MIQPKTRTKKTSQVKTTAHNKNTQPMKTLVIRLILFVKQKKNQESWNDGQ